MHYRINRDGHAEHAELRQHKRTNMSVSRGANHISRYSKPFRPESECDRRTDEHTDGRNCDSNGGVHSKAVSFTLPTYALGNFVRAKGDTEATSI